MKKYIIYLFLILPTLAVPAQDKTKSLSIEFFGAQNTVGINYDSRLKGNSGWGYRVGLGFGYGNSSFFGQEQETKGFGIPLEINYLLGGGNHKFETGAGASLGIYNVENVYHIYSPSQMWSTRYETKTSFGYCMFGNIGYRYQRPKGFLFRVGLSPSFNFGDEHGLSKAFFYPYLGLGWSF